ncbi:hypothetical protein ARMSODRAFT_1027674 [Armillaria solidipes]|uniref:Uncharacterized protein n=1 Tax=Armillaria solidipes TaxID=1076256 RepID=A0A2H3B816_9AGAR|nr:hypothetical protein ARMSODRAFT_1027674 [Armillaria solidipes]
MAEAASVREWTQFASGTTAPVLFASHETLLVNSTIQIDDILEDESETGAMMAERPTVVVTKYGNDVKPKQAVASLS